jgi:hypothetical protein
LFTEELEMRKQPWAFPALVLLMAATSNSACASEPGKCLNTNEILELSGNVSNRRVFGPPNFGATPKSDEVRDIWVLSLRHSVNICSGNKDEIDDEPIKNLKEFQLIGYKFGHQQNITISGSLERSQNAFHYTPVIMIVK